MQNAKAEYADRLRWTPVSPELVNEVAHFSMAFGLTQEECTEQVRPIFDRARGAAKNANESAEWIDDVQRDIEKRLVSEWEREERAPYSRGNAMLAKGTMGATRLIDRGTTIFRLWAPTAEKVRIIQPSAADAPELEPEEEPGVFSNVADVRSGQSYRYALTIGGSRVDVLDPYGREVDKAVEYNVFDDATADGTGPQITNQQPILNWHDLVVYQVHPATLSDERTYGGVIRHLDRIKELGCNVIDLIGPGEAIRYPFDYQPKQRRREEIQYGGTAGLRALAEAVHDRNMSLIVGVTTHDLLGRPSDDLTRLGEPYFPPDLVTVDCGPQPDFEKKHVQDLMRENARRWIEEIGVDGLRWTYTRHMRNVVPVDARGKPAASMRFLREMNRRIREVKPDVFIVAVDMNSDAYIVDRESGANFSTQWSAGLARAIRRVLKDDKTDLDELKRAILRMYKKDQSKPDFDAFLRIIFAESHTTVRFHGRLNDILGNAPDVRKRTFLATALSLVTPGIPMILQGQELPNDLPLDSGQVLDWRNRDGALYQRLHALIRLRRNHDRFTGGLKGHNVRVTYHPGERVIVLDRWNGLHEGEPGDHTIAIFNFTSDGEQRPEVVFPKMGIWRERFNADAPTGEVLQVGETRRNPVRVGPYGMTIFSQDVPGM